MNYKLSIVSTITIASVISFSSMVRAQEVTSVIFSGNVPESATQNCTISNTQNGTLVANEELTSISSDAGTAGSFVISEGCGTVQISNINQTSPGEFVLSSVAVDIVLPSGQTISTNDLSGTGVETITNPAEGTATINVGLNGSIAAGDYSVEVNVIAAPN